MHQAQQIRHLGRPRQYECRGQVAAEGSLGRTENANAVASTARIEIVGRRARRRHFYPALAFVGISTQRSGNTIYVDVYPVPSMERSICCAVPAPNLPRDTDLGHGNVDIPATPT